MIIITIIIIILVLCNSPMRCRAGRDEKMQSIKRRRFGACLMLVRLCFWGGLPRYTKRHQNGLGTEQQVFGSVSCPKHRRSKVGICILQEPRFLETVLAKGIFAEASVTPKERKIPKDMAPAVHLALREPQPQKRILLQRPF